MRPIFLLVLLLIFPFIGCGGDNKDSNDAICIEQPLAPEKSKSTIKSLKELTIDLSQVKIKDYWNTVHGEVGPLGEIACDLEKVLEEPIGGLASKTMLLSERLIKIANPELSTENRKNVLSEILIDIVKLKSEINEAIETIPENEISKLAFLDGLNKVVESNKGSAEILDKIKIDPPQNYEKMMRSSAEFTWRNKVLAQRNKELVQSNEELLRQQKEIIFKLDLAKAKRLMRELIENIS